MLFSDRSLLTMLHGLVVSGGALMLLVLALFALRTFATPDGAVVQPRHATALVWLTIGAAILLWLSVVSGTYAVFPMYRATPPEGIASLAEYPRALLMSREETRWLHSFGMEIKEHMPWIAAMLATAAAFVVRRHRKTVLADSALRAAVTALLAIAFGVVAVVALLGVFVNKIAPLW